ncbi:TauD/TfdA dioxygenase family protein [Plastoroseomonas arctica]|uniref:TauD/TfdA family dioxygenase n=1 Tax=Plastoroseomonas arctica TaxID=1509237 RepID=A0AAF1KPS9_9PROT|nr:TauD/TfdA family dioxygenase [Plastoroseomonas arctica]MBR0656443.1 TauD/TfdA family dioxygenase [Plastoroseomonas arctica]
MGAGLMQWRAAAARRGLTLRELEPSIGIEIGGIDLMAPEDAELTAILRGACVERTLLLIRGQQHLTPAGYVDFARRFGGTLDLSSRRDMCLRDHHEVFVVGNVFENGKPAGAPKVGLNWHTDHYHLAIPALFTFLHAIQIPPAAGETTYANGIAAWEALPSEMQARIRGLRVCHSRAKLYRALFPDATEQQCLDEAARFPDVVHPLVRTHPESGRRGLYLGGEWGSEIEGEDPALFGDLLAHMIKPDFTHKHRWMPGDVLMSDNRCSLHRASEWDQGQHTRRLHRIILLDEMRPE